MPVGVTLALSGGVVRSIAHIGVFQQLEASGIPISAIVGTSSGSLVGAFYAATRDLKRMEALSQSVRWRSLIRPTMSRRSLLTGRRLRRFCKGVLGAATFDQLTLPFAAVATNLRTGEAVVMKEGLVVPAVVASCSLPVIFPPVERDHCLLVDGGLSSQLPIMVARGMVESGVVVGVDVNAGVAGTAGLDTMVQIGVQSIALFAMTNAMRERPYADVMIDVDATGVPLYDLSKSMLLLERGRSAAKAKLGEIESALHRCHSTVQQKHRELSQ